MPNPPLRPIRTAAEIAAANDEQIRKLLEIVEQAPASSRRRREFQFERPTDRRSLRGIPAVGPGIGGGAVEGSDPLRAAMESDKRRRRREQEAADAERKRARRAKA